MKTASQSNKRNFKKQILEFLRQENFESKLNDIHQLLPMKVVNALLSILVTTDEELRNRVVKSFGEVVSQLAEKDIEAARILMRRLMLSVTEESGGIGWNTPEAMGEIMARSEQLANEYHKILISYTMGGGNELDFVELQKSVIAGLKRLSEVRPELVEEVKHLLK
ncbi:MAG: hypothetical protein KJN64_12620 [Ignavibacteria bacterium]|nr:hypothetical protein [Ignavibacteria bacterium]NNL21898.1 hypothetical protein [Ignavibacteriaceae bacterium]